MQRSPIKHKLSTYRIKSSLIKVTVMMILMTWHTSHAQSSNSTNDASAISTNTNTHISDSLIEEKLINLAIQGPIFKISEHQSKIDEYQLKSAKNSWLNLLSLSLNYNDQSFANTNNVNSYVYPKYFFGFNIPLGTLFSRTQVKASREQLEITKDNKEQLQRNVKASVITKYRQYKSYNERIVLQSQVINDEETAYLQAKEKFRNAEITIEEHNIAQKKYNDELVKLYTLQLDQDMIKIEIERIIGVNLDSILKPGL